MSVASRLLMPWMLVGFSPPAAAHSLAETLGTVVGGLLQNVVHIEYLFAIIALALLAARSDGLRLVVAGAVFAVAAALGFALARVAPAVAGSGAVDFAQLLVLGVLVALGWRLPPMLALAALTLSALALGLSNGWNAPRHEFLEFAAAWLLGAVLAFVAVVAGARRLRAAWTMIAVRVVGSWIAAIGLLMAAAVTLRP
ncbi:MAG: HupE/UreJ family protein [Thiotrichales bacterium]